DRIVVTKDGFVQQVDTPTNLYRNPINKFVAGFIGTPPMNFYEANVKVVNDIAEISFANSRIIKTPLENIIKLRKEYYQGRPLIMGIRPENIRVVQTKTSESILSKVIQKEILGSETLIYSDLDLETNIDYENSATGLIIKVPGIDNLEERYINLEFDFQEVHFFDPVTEICVSKPMIENDYLAVSVNEGKLNFCDSKILLPPALKSLEGNLEMSFPTDALIIGDAFKAEVISSEEIEGICLSRLKTNQSYYWGAFLEAVSGEVSLDFDYKKLDFYNQGKLIKASIPCFNNLPGYLVKRKRKDKNEYGLKYDLIFKIAEYELKCPVDMVKRLLSITDRNIFNLPLELCFSPDSVFENGFIKAEVKSFDDYGNRQYLLCELANTQFLIPCINHNKYVVFGIDLSEAHLIEPKTGIRI
ncbi:MAG: hypothetical protein PHX62_06430, partial [Bacilli bacterium]|nr:hypothetical protein [Bacilli bacterium]